MIVIDMIYVLFLLILLFVIIYKGFKASSATDETQPRNGANAGITRNDRRRQRRQTGTDRQNNIYTITDESGAASNVNVRYPDFLFLDPTSEEAARIRAQLEKDDKDLPSYDEVMGMRNATTPVALVGAGSSTSVSTADTIIAAPPYSETDPNPIPQIVDQPAVNELPMTATTTSTQPSTSRAARNATTVITLESMPSNTTV